MFEIVHNSFLESNRNIFVILVGGCSRAGKSTLSSQLAEQFFATGISSLIVNTDCWLISVDKRKPGSTVSERYDLRAINSSVTRLLKGETVFPPVYDPVSRKRLDNITGDPIQIKSGVLIVEGVIALADQALLKRSNARIFVEIPDRLRVKRLLDFYGRVKKVARPEYKTIISDREKEEIPFIKSTAANANLLFSWQELDKQLNNI